MLFRSGENLSDITHDRNFKIPSDRSSIIPSVENIRPSGPLSPPNAIFERDLKRNGYETYRIRIPFFGRGRTMPAGAGRRHRAVSPRRMTTRSITTTCSRCFSAASPKSPKQGTLRCRLSPKNTLFRWRRTKRDTASSRPLSRPTIGMQRGGRA